MEPTAERNARAVGHFGLPAIDRNVLVGTLILVGIGFGATWIGSRDFLPGARLFPGVLAAVGAVMTVIALTRVWRGLEPSSSPGREASSEEQSRIAYRRAAAILASVAAYFAGVYLIGFLPATALFIVAFARVYGQSYRYAAAAACAALAGIWALSFSMDLFLPIGVLTEAIVGGRL